MAIRWWRGKKCFPLFIISCKKSCWLFTLVKLSVDIDYIRHTYTQCYFGFFFFECIHRSETIIEWPGWPFFIPPPSQSVEKTLKSFKESLNTDRENNADLLMEILDRSNDIFSVSKRLAKKREEKERRQTVNLEQQLKEAIRELQGSDYNDDISVEFARESTPLFSGPSMV